MKRLAVTSSAQTDLMDCPTQINSGSRSGETQFLEVPANSIAESLQVVACPVCAGLESRIFYRSEGLPVHCCVLHDSRLEALEARKGDVRLQFCPDCEFVFNVGFNPKILDFQPGYDASLTFSPTFREFSETVADRLIKKYDLNGKNIIEVGCGEGYFLSLLAEKGGNVCVGFDPTIKNPTKNHFFEGSVTTVRDYYQAEHRDVPCEFLCCLSVMEDLQNPNQFVREITRLLGNRTVDCYFEIFNGMRAIEELHTWSILYEQCNYFSADSFARLFRQNGFEIRDYGTCYEGGEYLFVEATWDGASTQSQNIDPSFLNDSIAERESQPSEVHKKITKFESTRMDQVRHWTQLLDRYVASGQQGVVWGTGGKGVSFLNSMKGNPAIFGAVDINPRRSGKYVPGSGYQIMSPESLVSSPPAFIIVTNPLYENEIRQSVAQLGIGCDFYTT